MQYANTQSNRQIFIPQDSGSPRDGLMAHISSLGKIARLDFERCAVAGDVIFTIDGDSNPTSQQDEEARIGSLAYALKKLGNAQDAAEFIRCLNVICAEGDARYRQMAASHYYQEIAERATSDVLKEMGLLAMQLESLNAITELIENDDEFIDGGLELANDSQDKSIPGVKKSLFDLEVESISRMIRGRRKSACFIHDERSEWLSDLESSGAGIEELDSAFAYAESIDQYDEGGAIIVMSSHERTTACGRIDPEYSAEDLPERAHYLLNELRRD